MLRAAHLQLDNLAQIASLAEERHLQGASARSDVVQSAARIETVKGSLLHYQAQLDRWLTRLATLLGQQQLSGVTDAFPQAANNACTAPPGDTLVTPAVNIAQAQYQKANAQLAHAQAQLRPTISLDPSATRQLNTSSVQRGDTQRTQYSIFIQLKMPLYQGGYLDAQKQAAMHALHAATASLQHARFSARQQLLEAVSQIASLERTQAVIVQRHRLNTDTRDLYRQQYQALGNRALLDLLNAEQEIFQSDIDSHNLNAELHQLLLQCLTSTSTLRTVFGLDALINIHRGQIP
jgi:adhesin transport system outer membrane protein